MKTCPIRWTICSLLLLAGAQSFAQMHIEGTVYDKSLNNPIIEANVFSVHGLHTTTDSNGHYRITVPMDDTLYFSYLGKKTNPFPVRDIHYPLGFDISMDVVVQTILPAVLVTHNGYQQDSIEFRKTWQKTFDSKPDLGVRNFRMMPMRGLTAGAGLDLSMFFNRSARKSNELIQRWIINEERENYIDHKWNKRMVAKITGFDSTQLKEFMKLYRPTKEYIQGFETEYEFYKAIKEQGQSYLALAQIDTGRQTTKQAQDTTARIIQ